MGTGRGTDTLTPKQEAFAVAFVETGNASESYRRAYDVGENTKPETVWVKASEVLSNGKVAARVAELHEALRNRSLVTLESISDELNENRELAREQGKTADMNTATLGKAKLHGLMIDKAEQKVTVTATVLGADVTGV